MYKLRTGQPPIECVDGPLAGRVFEPGREYPEIPDNERERFERAGGRKTRDRKTAPLPAVIPSEDVKPEGKQEA